MAASGRRGSDRTTKERVDLAAFHGEPVRFHDWSAMVASGVAGLRKHHDHDSQSLHKSKPVPNILKDCVCNVDELSVNRGNWYYLDGTGHERRHTNYLIN